MKIISVMSVVVLLGLMNPVPGASSEMTVHRKKDPIFAGALSWYMPGLGQMYAGDLVKGGVFFVIEEALLIGTVLSFAELKLDVTGDVDIPHDARGHLDDDLVRLFRQDLRDDERHLVDELVVLIDPHLNLGLRVKNSA